ncbi:hypothetical protein D9M69_592390 [compost metagenome]
MSVTFSLSMVRNTSSASNDGTNTCGRPATVCAMTRAMQAVWNIGATCRVTLPVGNGISAMRMIAEDQRFMCDCITPFGRPVVPPVYMIEARSSPPRWASVMG